jgi:nucleotide-binding universal stress UspA family protein
MATHGRSGVTRWALGSVADRVVRASENPVALIRAGGPRAVREKGILKKVLVPVDGSKESEAVLPWVLGLSGKLGAQVVLCEILARGFQATTADGCSYVSFDDDQVDTNSHYAKSYLDKLGADFKQNGISVSSEVRLGSVADEIMTLADGLDVDLVAMSTHGRSGVGRLVLGSVADRILHEGSAPLLLVRPAPAK